MAKDTISKDASLLVANDGGYFSRRNFLDFLGAICIIVFFGSLILKIWLPDEVQYLLNRLWLTALLTFLFIIIFYGFICYKPPDADV